MITLPFPPNLLTDQQLAVMRRHADSEVRSLAEEEITRRPRMRPLLPPPAAPVITFEALQRFNRAVAGREDARYRKRLDLAKRQARKAGLPEEAARKVSLLLASLEPQGRFLRGPEAPRIAALVMPFLNARHDSLPTYRQGDEKSIPELLRDAEKGGHLHRGFADQLERAGLDGNPYLDELVKLERATQLYALDRGLRSRGRPKAGFVAVLAACLADEARAVNPDHLWPVVAKLLRPFLRAARLTLKADPEGLRQLVDRNRRAAEGEEPGRWEARKSRLRQLAGIEQEPPDLEWFRHATTPPGMGPA